MRVLGGDPTRLAPIKFRVWAVTCMLTARRLSAILESSLDAEMMGWRLEMLSAKDSIVLLFFWDDTFAESLKIA